jgi:hypothetical protein
VQRRTDGHDARARETIRNPVWDKPENMGQYRDDRQHVFLDGNGNLVIRATRNPDGKYVSAKLVGNYWGGASTPRGRRASSSTA